MVAFIEYVEIRAPVTGCHGALPGREHILPQALPPFSSCRRAGSLGIPRRRKLLKNNKRALACLRTPVFRQHTTHHHRRRHFRACKLNRRVVCCPLAAHRMNISCKGFSFLRSTVTVMLAVNNSSLCAQMWGNFVGCNSRWKTFVVHLGSMCVCMDLGVWKNILLIQFLFL